MRISFNGNDIEEFTTFDCVEARTAESEHTTDIWIFGVRAGDEKGDYIGQFKTSEFDIEHCLEVSRKCTKQLLEKGWLDLSKIKEIEIF